VVDDLEQENTGRRHRWVGLVGTEIAGTAFARRVDEDEVFFTVEVHPDLGSRGVGTALLMAASSIFPEVAVLRSVSSADPISMAFAVRNGFLPEGEQSIVALDPRTVAPAGPEPEGMRALTLDTLPDLGLLLDTNDLAAADDPSVLTRRYTVEQLRTDWWDGPDNAPDLSWGLVADEPSGPVLAAFSSAQVDRERGRSWSSMTATHPAYRGRRLALWVKRRTLNALADAGLTQSYTANDAENAPMVALNEALGYQPVARSIRLSRRMPR
jgi:GNAT superfamily N-acetyltransferase